VITIEEIGENDYNLSPSRYVSIVEEEQYRPISEIEADLDKLEKEREVVNMKITKILGGFKIWLG
jgi:type I restriction-modification system DNA methylase subunit